MMAGIQENSSKTNTYRKMFDLAKDRDQYVLDVYIARPNIFAVDQRIRLII